MKILYFDCFSGVSGDMTIGALLDAGGDPAYLKQELRKLDIEDEYELKITQVVKNGITSTKFDVILPENEHTHHHHHEHGHHHHEHHHDHSHGDDHHHHHNDHGHDHHDNAQHDHYHDHEHTHHHDHRSYQQIVKMIKSAKFSAKVENNAVDIFKRIGEAEAK